MNLDFGQIIQSLNLGIVILDRDLRIVFWNRWLEEHSRLTAQKVVGRSIIDLFPELGKKGFRWKSETVFKLGNFSFFSQQLHNYLLPLPLTRYLTSTYEHMQQNAVLSPLRNGGGDVTYVCVSIEDTTDAVLYREKLEKVSQELETMSLTDSLTGLPNRRHLMNNLEKEISRHKRQGGPFSVAILDVDHFKAVNDTHGHLCGDHVLTRLGDALLEALRTYDMVARYGGEEFCVVLANTDIEEGLRVMERVRTTIEETPFSFEGNKIRLTVSIGITSTQGLENPSLDAMLSRADRALYRAKVQGRNRSSVFSQEETGP